jgi:hypothetical protein
LGLNTRAILAACFNADLPPAPLLLLMPLSLLLQSA